MKTYLYYQNAEKKEQTRIFQGAKKALQTMGIESTSMYKRFNIDGVVNEIITVDITYNSIIIFSELVHE